MDKERNYLVFAVAMEEPWTREGLHEAISRNLRTPKRKGALFIRWTELIVDTLCNMK